MTGRELLVELGTIDERFYHEADGRGRGARRPLLIAAVVAVLLLLAGCGYAVLSGTAWFQAYFAREQKQPLSGGQMDLIAGSTKEFGASMTVGGYTLTLESAIAEPKTAYIKLRITGEKPFSGKSVSLLARKVPGEDRLESAFFPKGSSPTDASPFGAGTWVFDDPVGNEVSVLIRMDQRMSPDAVAFEAGVPYILHLTDLTQWDDGGGTILAEGPWDFEIVFDHLNDGQLELISQPATVSANGASLTLTSFKLGTMGAEAAFQPVDPSDMGTMGVLALSQVVLKDGSTVAMRLSSFDPEGHGGLGLVSPVDLKEVSYVELRDGTQLWAP